MASGSAATSRPERTLPPRRQRLNSKACRLGQICTRSPPVCLVEEQVREAEAAFRRLAGNDRSLTFYLDFALANYREPLRQKPLSEAAEAYFASKTLEHDRQVISAPQLTTIRRHLEVLKAHFPGATVAELSAPRLTEYLQHGNPALKTHNNRRGVISTFLKFAFQQDWIAVNPIEKVAGHRIEHRRTMVRPRL